MVILLTTYCVFISITLIWLSLVPTIIVSGDPYKQFTEVIKVLFYISPI
jgi:hypothetical protein